LDFLLKASAGGGGRRVVENEAEFESQMNRAISEALNALVIVLFLSKNVASPRHINSNHGR
jgi:propionyl-CoA carboxylase alpha chain